MSFSDTPLQISVLRRVRLVDPTSDHRDGSPATHSTNMHSSVDPSRQPRNHRQRRRQLGRQVLRHSLPVRRSIASAHRRDTSLLRQSNLAAKNQARRRIVHHRQQRRVIRIAQEYHPPASGAGAFYFALSL